MKKIVFLFFILIISYKVFARSPITQHIQIYNYSSQNIIITVEYKDISGANNYRIFEISNGIYNLDLYVHSSYIIGERLLKPDKDITIISYIPSPTASFVPDKDIEDIYLFWWECFDQIPFMEKMNSIFKLFKITTEDGHILIDLENIESQSIKKDIPSDKRGGAYKIEIFDYHFVQNDNQDSE